MSEVVNRKLVCDVCAYVGDEKDDFIQLSVVTESDGYLGSHAETTKHACSGQCAVRALLHYGPGSKHPIPDAARKVASAVAPT